MRGVIIFASITAWICCGDPAVMFEIVQQASLRMPSLGEERRERGTNQAAEDDREEVEVYRGIGEAPE